MRIPSKNQEAGFSLVETLLAGALLGTVLISVVALFALGGQNVKSGKELTKASALGMEMMEDFRRMDFDEAYSVIGGGCNESSREWRGESGSNDDPANIGIPGTVADDDCTFPANWTWPTTDTSYRLTLCRWANKAELQFPGSSDGTVRVRVDGFDSIPAAGSEGSGNLNFCDARFLRIRISVEWEELRRIRQVTYETLKF